MNLANPRIPKIFLNLLLCKQGICNKIHRGFIYEAIPLNPTASFPNCFFLQILQLRYFIKEFSEPIIDIFLMSCNLLSKLDVRIYGLNSFDVKETISQFNFLDKNLSYNWSSANFKDLAITIRFDNDLVKAFWMTCFLFKITFFKMNRE